MSNQSHTRRHFLRAAGAVSLAAPASVGFGLQLAAFSSATSQSAAAGYRALVCVNLGGGSDSNNMLLATDSDSWRRYWLARNTGNQPIALMPPGTIQTRLGQTAGLTGRQVGIGSPERWGGVLPLQTKTQQIIPAGTNSSGRTFAVHPMMAPLLPLYQAGRIAMVANVGPLTEPITKAQYLAKARRVPQRLFSHNDQETTWQAGPPNLVQTGWGGRFGDLLASGNGKSAAFTAMSTSGNSVFLTGSSVMQYQISTNGTPAVIVDGTDPTRQWRLIGSAMVPQQILEITQELGSTAMMQNDYNAIMARSANAGFRLNATTALPAVRNVPAPPPYINPVTGAVEVNSLAVQLQAVARMIAAAPSLGLKRQVFHVSMAGHDTHDNQSASQANNLSKLAHAMAAFDATLANLGGVDMRSAVTTFTTSEFSRTFNINGDGTDHAWGGHHIVMGGAVRGGDIYGQYPTLGVDIGGFNNPDMVQGSMIPTTSVDQYAATLGSWFGVSNTDLQTIFPNLNNFSKPNLGFMV
ncbi:DUF1501 domain-containing protein [Aquidulcibacter paucihalophilus]|uniref:DUF1501 domain-containing protein n=1 Tax=Aquidulcibacter paucihalophilus TaxID=1978549 RepID=UPI000A18E016|nr:DUF1501 domain-containing protein [Aquidulcibacter paucihalophilus]